MMGEVPQYCRTPATTEGGNQRMAGKTEYKNTWQKENVDRVNLTMPKGRKELIKAHAEAQGQSVNAYINTAIDEKMSRDTAGSPTRAAEDREVSLPSETGKCAPAASTGRIEGIADGD